MLFTRTDRKRFSELSDKEILALAIASEEDDGRIYQTYASHLRKDYPASAALFDDMAAEEDVHRKRLINEFQRRFGDAIPLIRREHITGYYSRRPIWLVENLGIERIRQEAANMEADAYNFYLAAAQRTTDPQTRELLGDLAAAQVAVAVRMQDPTGKKYLAFHQKLLGGRGQADKSHAMAAAKDAGLDMARLEKDMASSEVRDTLQESFKLAEALGMNGTPSYVIGNDVVIGAVGLEVLQEKVNNARCGKATC